VFDHTARYDEDNVWTATDDLFGKLCVTIRSAIARVALHGKVLAFGISKALQLREESSKKLIAFNGAEHGDGMRGVDDGDSR
jgi:hypothetical protein